MPVKSPKSPHIRYTKKDGHAVTVWPANQDRQAGWMETSCIFDPLSKGIENPNLKKIVRDVPDEITSKVAKRWLQHDRNTGRWNVKTFNSNTSKTKRSRSSQTTSGVRPCHTVMYTTQNFNNPNGWTNQTITIFHATKHCGYLRLYRESSKNEQLFQQNVLTWLNKTILWDRRRTRKRMQMTFTSSCSSGSWYWERIPFTNELRT